MMQNSPPVNNTHGTKGEPEKKSFQTNTQLRFSKITSCTHRKGNSMDSNEKIKYNNKWALFCTQSITFNLFKGE